MLPEAALALEVDVKEFTLEFVFPSFVSLKDLDTLEEWAEDDDTCDSFCEALWKNNVPDKFKHLTSVAEQLFQDNLMNDMEEHYNSFIAICVLHCNDILLPLIKNLIQDKKNAQVA